MRWKPNVTVAAIAQKNGRFLLVEEYADEHIVFNQPAGHLEKNETLIDAIKREVLEESCWEFIPESIVGIYLYPDKFADITYLRICFTGSCIKHHPHIKPDAGIQRAVWMTRDEIVENESKLRSPMVIQCIDDFLAGNRFPIEILQNYLPVS